jgi:CheY-like chemotaxis protein
MASCFRGIRHDELEHARSMCKKLADDVERAQKTLQYLQDDRSDVVNARLTFIVKLAEDIRAPMRAMMAMCSENVPEAPRVVVDTCAHIMTTINDLLQITTASSGRLCMENVVYSPHDLLGAMAKLAKREASMREADFMVVVHENVPRYVTGDVSRLRQCILKLCRFLVDSGERKLTMQVKILALDDPLLELMPTSQMYLTCLYSVGCLDNSEERCSMMHPGSTGDETLSLIADLIECTGGRLLASAGRRTLHLVMHARVPTGSIGLHRRYDSIKDSSAQLSYTLLIHEANRVFQRIMLSQLTSKGHVVDISMDHEETLLAAQGGRYDCLIVNRDRNGVALIAAIREHERSRRLSRVPALLSLAFGLDDELVSDSIDVDGTVILPCSANVLQDRVADCVVARVSCNVQAGELVVSGSTSSDGMV